MSTLLQELANDEKQITGWRHHMHRHPELAFEERHTAEYITGLLRSWGYEVATGVGKTGIVASLTAGDGRKAIGLRADIDALPVAEKAAGDHRSTIEGRSHTCGHDGHSAMLLGAAQHLARTRSFNGTVRLIFQPAEEVMGGALAMIKDGLFERFPMDAVFGMHNMPGLKLGTIHFTTGPVMAAVDNWEIELGGKGSHGSMPERSIDPVVAGAALVMALQTITSRNVAPLDSAVVSVGAFLAGDAGNVIPQSALLRLSIRTSRPETRELVLGKVRSITAAQADCYGVSWKIREGTPGAVLVNDAEQTAFAATVAKELLGADKVVTDGPRFMGSEDFAFFAQHKPGTYCFIGNGDTPMVHHPQYDFDDRNLPVGAAYWVALAESFLR
ncbi:M20 family metallopeptidase [Aromatoleum toluclasticum]|uniref:M20 aminoacylase family protein n=1 Tax=Aromatoleum toluclasticum TaxID=92003 RepID=UPI001D18A8B8|nr:M20 aminoacylase family protein [Aromatoleum toluclasticum]MCC4116078.1 M20 family metallopeptidase [Aromatoleum toluclasticum]